MSDSGGHDSDDKLKSRRHVHLYDEDWELLQRLYGSKSVAKIGASEAVRKIVHQRCQRLRQKITDAQDSQDQFIDAEDQPQKEKGVVEL